jgi:hypothetical protein
MTENGDQCRITFTLEPLQVVRHDRRTNFDTLLTGDEARFYYEYLYDSLLTHPPRPISRLETGRVGGSVGEVQ